MARAFIKYFESGSWPLYIGFAKDETSYLKEMKRLGIPQPPPFVEPPANATTHCFYAPHHVKTTTVLVCFGSTKGRSREQVAALAAHEAAHVWQEVCDAMGGDSRCRGEHEAYGIQWITQVLLEELWRK